MDDVVMNSAPASNPERDAGDSGTASGGAGDASAPAIKRRAPIACRRCRRMRSKCVHEKAQPPCKACLDAGLGADECIFPVRGQPDNDREFRHPRVRAEKTTRRDPAKVRREILDAPVGPPSAQRLANEWDVLPPLPDLVESVKRFSQCYFQLSFIPKQHFPERLLEDHRSISVFLILSILGISARLTPALATRYGSAIKASEFFMERAANLAYSEIYQEPTLERCQAFYLLSVAQQGSGLRNPSSINMGISIRMATLMQLHREETYHVSNPTPNLLMRAESARRTLWMLHGQDQVHSGPSSPVSLSASDITALLPCDEADFTLGRQPTSRAALQGTPPAIKNPALVSDRNRSLFATLIQAHHFWGTVGRRAVDFPSGSRPWDPSSEFAMAVQELQDWEHNLPREHLWSAFALKGYKTERQDLAYLEVAMIPRLCHIVLRRPYLADIINMDFKDEQQQAFFSNLSLELFHNVRQLFEMINAQFAIHSPTESVGAQMAAFCVYSCGLLAGYLCKYPNICPDPIITRDGPMMLQRTMSILMQYQEVWPLGSRWVEALEKLAQGTGLPFSTEEGMAGSKDPMPPRVVAPSTTSGSSMSPSPSPSLYSARSHFEHTSGNVQPLAHDMMTPLSTANSHISFQQQAAMQPPVAPSNAQQFVPPTQQLSHLYMAPNNLGMPMEGFEPSQQLHVGGSSSYDMSHHPPAPNPLYNQLAPTTDGFEGELQFYIEGHQDWTQSNPVFERDMN